MTLDFLYNVTWSNVTKIHATTQFIIFKSINPAAAVAGNVIIEGAISQREAKK